MSNAVKLFEIRQHSNSNFVTSLGLTSNHILSADLNCDD